MNSKQSQKRYYSYKYLDYKNYSNNKIVYNVQFYNEVGKTDKRNSPSLKNMPSYIAKEQSLQNQLKGKHYSEVIERLGAYLRTVEDGKGGTIYIWETYNEAQTYDNINPLYGRTVLGVKQETFLYQTHTQSASSSMQVMCNSDGIIYKVIYKEQGYE